MPKPSARRPSTCTMPGHDDLGLRPRAAIGIDAAPPGAHGIGHHVLRTTPITLSSEANTNSVSARIQGNHWPAAAASMPEATAIRPAPTNTGALRAEQRHGVDQFAEHHLDGPRQREPYAQGGKLCRRVRQVPLDPECLGDRRQASRAIGEIHHQQRQIGQTHGADRGQQRVLDLLAPVITLRRSWCVHGDNPAAASYLAIGKRSPPWRWNPPLASRTAAVGGPGRAPLWPFCGE